MVDQVRPQPLNARTLAYWRGRLPAPAYDRDLVTPGVVHFGVGGFHRAHQAMYHDRLMAEGATLDWGICGVGVMTADRLMTPSPKAATTLMTPPESLTRVTRTWSTILLLTRCRGRRSA